MTTQLEPSIVRIREPNGQVVGVGFLVGERQALTCAHIVAQALGLLDNTLGMPEGEVMLDFPLVAPVHTLTANVVHWWLDRDFAELQLNSDPPSNVQPVCLVTADDLWGHAFRAFGFPSGYEDGVWTSGVLRGRTAAGWVQIEDIKEPGYWVQPGFSGTPVWDEQLNGVVGMAVATDTDRATKAAFMIPTQALIEASPELTKRSLEAGSLEHLQMQLTRLEEAQRTAVDPSRFQPQIDALRERIVAWDGRVERQRERIAEGLEEHRRQRTEEQERREKERLRVVGQPPLDVADYFKNRQRDLEKLGQLLAEPTTRLVSVIGHGGMGKTALACKVLQDLERHRWPHTASLPDQEVPVDGILYLSTRTAGLSLERLFLDCAKLLSGERQEPLAAIWTNPQLETHEKVACLLEALSEGRYVILLDNLEDLLDDQGQLTDADLRLFFDQALTTVCGAQLVVTSRVALAFRREVMRFDRQVKLLEGLPVEDSVALLRELDPNGDYGLRDAPEEQLAEAVELARGVPRALEVLAGILANDPFASPGEVVETFYEREDVVQALIEENYKRLDQDARRVIEAMAVFRRPVPPLAVDYLLEPFAPGLDVPGILRRLTRTNIVSVDRAAKTVTLHPIDQDYAYSQLPEEEKAESEYTRQALERRAADYYVQLRTPRETWKSIEDLEPQLNEFEHRVRAGDYDGACRVLDPIDSSRLFLWGYYTRLVGMREKLLEQLAAPELQAINLGRLGVAYHELAQPGEAIGYYEKALSIARKIGDRRAEGVWLGYLGQSHRSLGDVSCAIELHEEALVIARQVGDRRSEGVWLGNLGRFYRLLGQIERAVKFCKEALVIAQQIGDRRSEGIWFGHLGFAHHALGESEQAIKFHEKALSIAREIDHRLGEQTQLAYVGLAHYVRGQLEQAIESYEEALIIAGEIGNRRGESYCLLGVGRALLSLGEPSKAHKCCREACDLNVPQTRHLAMLALGITLLHQSDMSPGNTFAEAVVLCQTMLDRTTNLYGPRYALGAALVGQAACDPSWAEKRQREDLLTPALKEYRRALNICGARGVVQDALRDLELIRAAGIEGLEPVFELLEEVLCH
jgi:tetratricopeptide (TPR) repeat protein